MALTVGQGISELRVHCGAGYRVYFQKRGATIIVLLCGGSKSTQAKDIKAGKKGTEGISFIPSVPFLAKGMAQISGQTGLSREQLYRSFSERGNPTLKTTLAVIKALGIEMTAKAHV